MGPAYSSICALPCSDSTCEVYKRVSGNSPYVQQTPKLEKGSACPPLGYSSGELYEEKWLGAGDAVSVLELLNKAIVSVPCQHNSVNLSLHYCK